MILDRLQHADAYAGLHPRFAEAFRYLREQPLSSWEPGRYDIIGDEMFLLLQTYETKRAEDGFWEAHRRYIDIQFMLRGAERMGYACADGMRIKEDHLQDRDYMVLEGAGDAFSGQDLLVEQGAFAVFFPQDAHMPCLRDGQPRSVKKAVIKVRI